ncbi:alpha/beta hydrolase [Pseudomonas sp. GD03944]|uniref:alpha/beta fold hydrolase n=1 Tax=Pseudomonas sp. GD03944 TaxID=2975409 RepID=UPI00244697A4|nr:alpha/beta hydrolase [Pseudomonas sp. GD03944]MDH1261966.1 alpha/beta hydrolase [Pseudomonas sp. GD03944]
MRPATAVVEIKGKYNVHTEFYGNPAASKTIILVNGSLATTASFAQTVKYLQPQFNVVAFDLPYAGQSKAHNRDFTPITKEDEAAILLSLIDHYGANYLMSFSWGGVASMLALAQRPSTLEKAAICSFSPILNVPMLDYLHKGLRFLNAVDRDNIALLVNSTIGKHLPSLFKRFNHKHVSTLDEHEYRQMYAHIKQILNMEAHCRMECLQAIDVPVLFVNGERDEYTSVEDACLFAQHIEQCQFSVIDNAGHFLDMEHKAAWLQSQRVLLDFFNAPTKRLHKPGTGDLRDLQAMAV